MVFILLKKLNERLNNFYILYNGVQMSVVMVHINTVRYCVIHFSYTSNTSSQDYLIVGIYRPTSSKKHCYPFVLLQNYRHFFITGNAW